MPKNTRGVQVKQIAEHLGLSSGTVSIVLNGRGDELRISKETQKIVLSGSECLKIPEVYR